ncbi:hypothetical protein [Acinetobacter sp. ANC 4470]|uniref:hypothetical protein n=1 Tax=Acinetobacter sp. ANC 4470 TaxID=1977881 RepID=UPI0011786C16|nr:hypothetical protein [Acinetobacter sp. ANC 4470]
MKYRTTLTLSILTVTLMGCQMVGEYALMGGKQALDSSNTYSIKNDLNSMVDISPDGMKSKKEMVGKYIVNKQWTRIIRWDVSTVDIHLDDGSVVVDLISKGKEKPFYGFKAGSCSTLEKPQGKDGILIASIIKKRTTPLSYDIKQCGKFYKKSDFTPIIEMTTVKKGYELNVNSTSNIVEWDTKNKFIVPEDGYILTVNYDEFSSSGFAQSPGTAYITMYLKKLPK